MVGKLIIYVVRKFSHSKADFNLSTSDIDTDTLLKAIKKIQNNYESQLSLNNDSMKGGATKNKKQQIMGYRQITLNSIKKEIPTKKRKVYLNYSILKFLEKH